MKTDYNPADINRFRNYHGNLYETLQYNVPFPSYVKENYYKYELTLNLILGVDRYWGEEGLSLFYFLLASSLVSIFLFDYLSVYLSIYQSILLSIGLEIGLHILRSIYLLQ